MKNLKDKYILAVSGGPDSMALLDMCRQHKIDIIVAHVNYHQRESALRDQHIVEHYCQQYEITCFCKSFDEDLKGNFQRQAREFRYAFFKELGISHGIRHVLVAHHLDDVIETYLLQLNRKSIPSYYGIKTQTCIDQMVIIRPLLAMSKEAILLYLKRHHVPYGLDETNESLKYTRNRIRYQVANLTSQDKQAYIKEIEALNETKSEQDHTLRRLISHNRIHVDDLFASTCPAALLRLLFRKQPSDEHITSMLNELKTSKRVIIPIYNDLLIKEYQTISLVGKPQEYSYVVYNNQELVTDYFRVVKEANAFYSATIAENEYPLTIRNASVADKIKLPYGTKPLARWFIDHKIPYIERMQWPVVLNRHQQIVLVPGIGCDLEHYSNIPNFFVIK